MKKEYELLPECPFCLDFKPNRIICEGVNDHSEVVLKFSRPRFLKEHQEGYCCSMNFGQCPVAKMLYNKYED